MAWSTTEKVGCGFRSCDTNGDEIDDWDWIVCRYDPPGNFSIMTTRPYCTATQTTGCWQGPPCSNPDGWHDRLENDEVSNAKTVHVCQTITTGPALAVAATGTLTLRGPLYVALGNGLSVYGALIVRND